MYLGVKETDSSEKNHSKKRLS